MRTGRTATNVTTTIMCAANAANESEATPPAVLDALRGFSIAVTGGAGYVGSVVSHELARHGARVVVLDDLSAGHAWATKGLAFVSCDVRDAHSVERALRAHEVQAVCHLAAQANIPESYANPTHCNAINLGGTEAVLHAMERVGVSSLAFASTCAVYAPPAPGEILREGDREAPESPYARSKLAAEQAIEAWVRRSGGTAACFRFFNAAGADREAHVGEAHEPETHLIPRVLRWLKGEGSFAIYGDDYPTDDGTCVRDYVHVLDIAAAHAKALALVRHDRTHIRNGFRIFNVGSGVGTTVQSLVERARALVGTSRQALVHPRRDGDAPRLLADPARARQELGWSAQYDLETILRDALWWERNSRVKCQR